MTMTCSLAQAVFWGQVGLEMLPTASDAADVLALCYSVGCWLSLLPFLVLCCGQHLLEIWEVEGVSFVEFLFVEK